MAPVIDHMPVGIAGFRFRQTLFGHQVLQIGITIKPWDTNTGMDDGDTYTKWRDATRYEADEFLHERGNK